MSNTGPTITIEAFESKYPKQIKDKFDAICKLISSGDKAGAGVLFRQLPSAEAALFKQYPNEAKVYTSLQKIRLAELDKKIDAIDCRLGEMKEEKKIVLNQYRNDTAQNMREFKSNHNHVESKKPSKKNSSCSMQ